MDATNQPSVEPAAIPETLEGARERHSQLISSRDFSDRITHGDLAASRELDALQRFIELGEKPPPTSNGPTTPEQAKARKAELMSSREWVARHLGGDKSAVDELALLQRQELGLPAETPPEPAPRELGVPEAARSYMFAEPIPEGSEQLAQTFQAAAHGAQLTTGEFREVHEQALRDAKANAGRSESEIEDKFHADLGKIWGSRYDQMVDLVNRYVADEERTRPGTMALIRERGLAFNKSLMLAIAHKALKKYG